MRSGIMGEKKQIAINLASSLLSFAVSFGISFFLSPYITRHVGSAAHGFVSLGNQFVSYIQIVTVALNSMAARFITLKLYENREDEAKVYFSSVFFSNIIMTIVMAGPLAFVVVFLERLLEVPSGIVSDVKFLWALIFLSFGITLICNVFSVATYAKNRLELSSLRSIESSVLRALLLFLLFFFLEPSLVYVGISIVAATVYVAVSNIRYTRILLPEMRIKRSYFRFSAVKELISAGIWNSLTSLSKTLLAGLDLLIANLLVGASPMGVLSIAKTLPSAIMQLNGTIPGAFSPQFVVDYAHKDKEKLLKDIGSAIKITSVLTSIPLIGLAVFGEAFFTLWMPTQDAKQLHFLSILTIAANFFTAPIQPLYTIYTVTNKVKMESISVFIQGLLSTLVVFVLLFVFRDSASDTTKLCIIAGVSSVFGSIRCLTFTPLYAAHCLKVKPTTFYPAIGRALFALVVLYMIESVIYMLMPCSTWLTLIFAGAVASLAGVSANIFLTLNKEERVLLRLKINEILYRNKT